MRGTNYGMAVESHQAALRWVPMRTMGGGSGVTAAAQFGARLKPGRQTIAPPSAAQ